MKIKDKIVLITGASSGIGRAVALVLAQAGAKIIINYAHNKKGADETLRIIEEAGSSGITIQADVSKENEVQRMFNKIKEMGKLDICINNAGVAPETDFLKDDVSIWEKTINSNLLGSAIVSRQAIWDLISNKKPGVIVNISSALGEEAAGDILTPIYNASKAGINSLTKTWAKKYAEKNIRVNAVGPGIVKTPIWDNVPDDEVIDFINTTQYLKRFISTEEIAGAVKFLIENDAMTGQVIYVDAGFTLK